jgi:hypothetical protein
MVITALGVVVMAMAAAGIYERSVLESRKLPWRQALRNHRETAERGTSRADTPGRQVVAASVN